MKYVIERTSDFWNENQPVEGAWKEKVHNFDSRVKAFKAFVNYESWLATLKDVHEDEDNVYGTKIEPEDVWVAEVESLHDLVEKYGKIILFKADNEEGLWKIEIYDDYRE